MTTHYWQVERTKNSKGEVIYIVAESNNPNAFIDRKNSVIVEADIRTSDAKVIELAKAQFNSK